MIDKWDTKKRELLLMYEDCAKRAHEKTENLNKIMTLIQGTILLNGVTYNIRYGYLTAEIQNRIVGSCYYYELGDCGIEGIVQVNNIYVEPEYRGKKIATTMLACLTVAQGNARPHVGYLTSQGGESNKFRNLLLGLGAIPTKVTNCLGTPILFLGNESLLNKMIINKAKGINYYLRLEREGLKNETNI